MSVQVQPQQYTIPRLDSQWFANVCALGPRPLVVTGWFKLWLQGHFADAANIEGDGAGATTPPSVNSPALVRNLWKPDEKLTKISIESITKWTEKLTEHHPAIIIKCNAWKRLRLGIGDKMMGMTDPTGQEHFANFWQGSHTLFCITGDGAETYKLAAEVFRELNEFGQVIRRILDLRRFEVLEVGEIMQLKTNAKENFVVPVTAGYAYEEAWSVAQQGPLLKRVDLAVFQP